MSRAILRQILPFLVVIFLFAACAPVAVPTVGTGDSQPAAAPEPAAEPATIVVYTALEDDQLSRYIPAFQAEHPEINVEIVRDSTGIVTAKLLAEKDNPQADVVWGLALTSLLIADAEEMLEPYTPAGLDRINPRFRDPDEIPSWVGIDVWMSAFCVNTIELEAKGLPMPSSWADLTDPVYKGEIVMPNPASSGTGYLSVSAMLQMLGEEDGWTYLDGLHENIAQYTHSGSKPCRLAGTGEFTIGISFGYRGIRQAEAGEPIATIFPTEGSGWEMEANALVKKDAIKPAAKTFLDWTISDSAMREYARGFAITGAPTDVPIPAGFPADPVAQLVENDFAWAALNRDAILAEWTLRYDSKSEAQ
jgi:iron(III) transport system substrate-binding protein